MSIPDRLRAWLEVAVRAGASDLHLIAGHSPVLRVHGELVELAEAPLAAEEAEPLFAAACPPGAF